MKQLVILLFISFVFLSFLPGQVQEKSDKDELSYEVSVDAQLVPIFAVDKEGNPVYGLKQEDFELYTDGKLVEIISFDYYSLKTTENTGKIPETQPPVQPPVKPEKSPERLNFIIIDSIASNRTVLKPAIEVVKRIINSASPGDGYVLLESRCDRGIDYLIGPEKDKTKLFAVLNHIENSFLGRQTNIARSDAQLMMTAGYNQSQRNKKFGLSRELALINLNTAMGMAKAEQKNYINDIRVFSSSIQ